MNSKNIKMYKIVACSLSLLAFVLIIIFSIFYGSKNEAVSKEKGLNKHSSIDKEGQVDQIERNTEDSLFLKRIIDGDFFEQEHSEKLDFDLVVRHCLSHTDEQYDEAFSDGLSHMLQKYPKKINGIQKAIGMLSLKDQKTAWYNMIVCIMSSWIMENLPDSIDQNMFYHTYPFFKRSSEVDSVLVDQIRNYSI